VQRSSTWYFRFFLSLLSLSFGLFLASSTPPALIAASAQIDGLVIEQLAAQGTVRVLILLAETDAPTSDVQSAQIAQAQASVLAALPAADFQLHYRYQSTPALAGVVTAAGLDILRNQPAVRAVQVDQPGGAHLDRSVPALGADIVHTTYGFTGQGVTVAVLDTGIDTDHPDLAGSIVAQHCFLNGACQPGNSAESANAEDENGHGSHVAGIITSDGGVAGRGFAPDANIVAVRVLDASGSGFVSDWVAGLDWLYANLATQPVQIINMSLGTFALYPGNCDAQESVLTTAINQLHAAGVTIFASSGNQGSNSRLASPACNTNVIAVGATYDGDNGREPDAGSYQSGFGSSWPNCFDNPTSLQKITCFTNSNALLDIVAPGAPLESTFMGGGVATYWGTSQAAPTAAGIAALLLQADQSLTPAAIESLLKTSGQPVVDPKNNLQFPLINAHNAILNLLPKPPATLTLTAPITQLVGVATPFLVTVGPPSAAQPITYVWQASGQPAITHTGGLSDSVTFAWPTPGPQTVQVKAINAGGMVSTTHLITIKANALTGVAIAGPTVGSTGVTQTLTATSSPLAASQPITYVWQASGQPVITHRSGLSDSAAFVWSQPGLQTVQLKAINAGGVVSTTHLITIEANALTGVAIAGPTVGSTGVTQTLTATSSPLSVSLPITYVWQIDGQPSITHTNGISDPLVLLWTEPGIRPITVTASNAVSTVTATHQLSIALVAPVSVSITGPLTDATNLPVSFLANVQPISVSLPITYVWQATAQATVTHTHASTDRVQFTWPAAGPVTLTLTAMNRAGVVTDSHLVALIEEQRIYLPLIQR